MRRKGKTIAIIVGFGVLVVVMSETVTPLIPPETFDEIEAVPAIINALQDVDCNVRYAAARDLCKIGPEAADKPGRR